MREQLALKKKAKPEFLANYKLASRILKQADKARGIPSLRSAVDAAGEHVLIKSWPRDPKVDDSDLHEIWRNETRQLYRLGAIRGSTEIIAQLRTSAIDDVGYHLVLSAEQRLPLATLIARNEALTFSNRKTVRGRRLLWANLLRVANGLDTLHMQGMLHRNLTTWSVLSDDGREPDFQLTGFEWSMRIVGLGDLPTKQRGRNPILDGQHSFTRDWQQFGELATELFDLPIARVSNTSIASHDVADYLTAAEARLIRELLQVLPSERLEGRHIKGQIDKIILSLDATIQGEELAFQIVLPLGPNGRLAPIIREASDFQIEADDEERQLAFVENDLAEATVVALNDQSSLDGFRTAVRGTRLTYYLSDYLKSREKIPSNWEIAMCSGVGISSKSSGNPVSTISLSKNALVLVPLSEMSRQRIRTKLTSWQLLRQKLMPKTEVTSRDKLLRKSLVLSQMLDYVFAASDVYPVFVSRANQESGDEIEGQVKISVRPRKELQRERLSAALGLKDSIASRLISALTGDQVRDDRKVTWILTDDPTLGERSESGTEWQFLSKIEEKVTGETQFIFVGERPPPTTRELFLVPGDAMGRDSQLSRRLKSLAALSEHRELSGMLTDPRLRILNTHDVVVEDAGFLSLDPSKQAVFRAVVETHPLFLVQGPPGVGKTRLVRELVRQALKSDGSTRLLLSAQSNYAVDHLMHEIEKVVAEDGDDKTVIVRCAPPDRKDVDIKFDLGQQTKTVLKGLLNSELLKGASEGLKNRTEQLAQGYGMGSTPGGKLSGSANPVSRKALEGLVLRSANLVFATTNSADLETLIEERNQFDWAIIEEAGKATGAELVTPMLLSSKRLMIGDHFQLPPFGEERVVGLLNNPIAAKKALEIADEMVGRSFRDAMVDEIFGEMGLGAGELQPADLATLCEEAARSFSMFETLIETEYARQARDGQGPPIAAPLTQQHRMHPIIADVVSHAFYKDKLATEPSAQEKFDTGKSPVHSSNLSVLPDTPIVWIDMPWVQQESGMKVGETAPRYVNHRESEAIARILEHLVARDSAMPSLAILSPYSRQVRELSQMVTSANGKFPSLSGFKAASDAGSFCTTVDSFQGNEADCVIVSLVRNNGFGSMRSALGFLADPRRLNVLMSRAKWRLIVVGSLPFLRSVYSNDKPAAEQKNLEFLGRLLSFFPVEGKTDGITVVPFASLMRGPK